MPQTDYKLTLDDSGVIKTLTVIDKKFDKMAETGDKSMKKVGKSGLNMGNVISGAAGGAFVALAGAALEFGKVAISTFANVIKSNTLMAAQFDTTRKKFINIFEGQEDQADAVMEKIGQRAAKLGIDLNEGLGAAAAFIPDLRGAEDPIKQLDNLLGAFAGLAQENPEQGIAGARFAIDEAIGGNLKSLQKRFNLNVAEIKLIKEAQKEYGETVGIIEGINRILERKGVDVEAASKTLAGAAGQVQFAVSKLQVAMGDPIADQLVTSMGTLNKILTENSDDLELMAASIGDVVAKVVDFIGTNLTGFLEDIDTEGVLALADGFQTAWNSAELLLNVLFDLDDVTFDDMIDSLTTVVNEFNEAAQKAAQFSARVRAEQARARAELGFFKEDLDEAFGAKEGFFEVDPDAPLGFLLAKVSKGFASVDEETKAAALGQEAYDQVIKDSLSSFEKFSDAEAEDAERKKERKKAQDADTEASLADAEAKLKQGDAASEAAAQLAELGLTEKDLEKIQKDAIKTQEDLTKAEESFAQKRLDIARDTLRERADLERDFSQDRIDLARKSAQDIASIESDHRQAIEDQGRNLGRDARDLGGKQSKERSDAAKTLRDDLLNVEQNFQDEMRRIQRTAQQSMEEAERGLDAQAFVEAIRQQEVAQEEAAITREGAESDVRAAASERSEELKQAQAEERAVLRQSDQDKLEDLQIQLQRELEAQTLSDQLALEQQGIDEQRRLEQQKISEERRLEDQAIDEQRRLDALLQGQAERLAKMVEGLDAETAAVVLAEANKLAAVEDFAGASQAILDGLIANVKKKAQKISEDRPKDRSPKPIAGRRRLGGEREDAGGIAPDKSPLFLPVISRRLGGGVSKGLRYRVGEVGLEGYVPRRAFGGDTKVGQPTVVGEFGEELFIPPSSGTIIPNSQMGSFLDGNTTNVQQSTSNTQNNLGGFAVSQSMIDDPIQRSQLENFILDIMSRN